MAEPFDILPARDEEGFHVWQPRATGLFFEIFGPIRCRIEPDGKARVRIETQSAHANGLEMLHGGFLAAFIDQALFNAVFTMRRARPGEAVTLSSSLQFIRPGRIGMPLDALVEVIDETRRLLFLRGLLVQDEATVASFEATLRKLEARST